ncbi:hypothetical protein F2Q69_00022608 [Brassica cretica]|uniref:Uncharacterized protein n=1 Tax=Brassica cretica TaxID=69181 RepID=A0A8S9Q1S5_BRACR|nr:hypothetical protein F2Q69_00022608 [Brassica cretica]
MGPLQSNVHKFSMSPDDTPANGNRLSASVTPASDSPVAPNPSVPEMLQAIMARFIQQEETNKATSNRLAALAAALGTLDGENDRAETARRRLFATTNPNLGFRDYFGINPTITIEDALHDSKNFIKMDEDKQQALKPTTLKTSDAQEPRQHAPYKKKGPVYAISEDDQPGIVSAVREPGWNVWECDTEGKTQQSRKPAWLASTSDGRTEVEPPKPKTTKNGKSWSKSKDKKKKSIEKKEEDSPPAYDGDQSHHEEESTSDKEKPKARRKIFTIRATPSPAPSTTAKPEDDLSQSLNQKSGQTIESLTPTNGTLMEVDGAPPRTSCSVGKLNASDARHILEAKRKDPLHRQDELKQELWSNNQSDGIETTDLRVKFNSKIPDLREKYKRCKTDHSKAEPELISPYQRKTQDLRTRLNSLRAERTARPEKEH